MTPPTKQQRQTFSGYYDRPLHSLLFRWVDLRKLGVIRRAFARLAAGSSLIDVGCGSGSILARIDRPGDLAVAGDIDLRLLIGARARGVVPLRLDFDATLPLASDTVDGALIVDALEHAERPREILAELHRVLRPGGTLVVFTPPYDSVTWVVAEKVHNLVTRRSSDHISPFTRESLTYAMAERFADLRIGRVNCGLSMYAVATK